MMTFYYGPSVTQQPSNLSRFRDKRQFRLKVANSPCIFKAPAEGVPLELGTDAMGQKLELWGFTRWPKS